MPFCSHCGTSLPSEARFCSSCGRRLDEAPVAASRDGTSGPECELSDHHWQAEQKRVDGDEIVSFVCQICGVGHEARFHETTPRRVSASLRIFPSTGETEVSETFVQWTLMATEAKLSDLRSSGYEAAMEAISIEVEP